MTVTTAAEKSALGQTHLVSGVIANLPPRAPPLLPTYYHQRWAFCNYISVAALENSELVRNYDTARNWKTRLLRSQSCQLKKKGQIRNQPRCLSGIHPGKGEYYIFICRRIPDLQSVRQAAPGVQELTASGCNRQIDVVRDDESRE